jgi:hypothetical protein
VTFGLRGGGGSEGGGVVFSSMAEATMSGSATGADSLSSNSLSSTSLLPSPFEAAEGVDSPPTLVWWSPPTIPRAQPNLTRAQPAWPRAQPLFPRAQPTPQLGTDSDSPAVARNVPVDPPPAMPPEVLDDTPASEEAPASEASVTSPSPAPPQLPQALARIKGRNFEPEVVSTIQSQRVASPRKQLLMGVISGKSPFWLPAISRLGKVSWIASTSPEGFDVPTGTRLCQPQDKPIANQLRDYPVDILFFENSGPYPDHPLWKAKSVKMIVWLRGRRGFKPPSSDWSRCSWRLKHSELGGVTANVTVAQFAVYSDLPEFRPQSRPGIPCDLSSVVNKVKGGVPCKPRPADSPPLMLSGNTLQERFVLPSVFLPYFSVRRKLDPEEILTAIDVPRDNIGASTPWRRSQLVREIVTPGKTMSAIVTGVEEWWDLCYPRRNKRTRCSAAPQSVVSAIKRRKPVDECSSKSTAQAKKRSQKCPDVDHLRRKIEKLGEMLLEEPLKPLLDSHTAKHDKFKLTKEDDAEVSYHLWNDRLCDLLKQPRGKLKLIAIFDFMRKRLLVRWKGNIT